ncbi:MAG: hypothetical protein EB059_03915 [Alphaproteobacteria bacterium]|nr:hypothetical protein [Alphaproteobacteria bacterium]
MINLPTLILLGIMIVAASAFVLGAMLWLKRLRANLASAVSEALARQITHGQKVEEALAVLQLNQKKMEGQVLILAEAQRNARNDINTLAQRFEQREISADAQSSQNRILH